MTADPTFTRHDPAEAEKILDNVIVPVYVASHQDVIGQPFYSAERFAERVVSYMRAGSRSSSRASEANRLGRRSDAPCR